LTPLTDATGRFFLLATSVCPRGLGKALQTHLPLCQSWTFYEIAMRMANPDADLGLIHYAMTHTGLFRFLYFLYATVAIQKDTCNLIRGLPPLHGGPLKVSLPLLNREALEAWVGKHGFGPHHFASLYKK